MSSYTRNQNCPECDGEETLVATYHQEGHDLVEGICLKCGFCYYTVVDQASKAALAEERKALGFNPKTNTFEEDGEEPVANAQHVGGSFKLDVELLNLALDKRDEFVKAIKKQFAFRKKSGEEGFHSRKMSADMDVAGRSVTLYFSAPDRK